MWTMEGIYTISADLNNAVHQWLKSNPRWNEAWQYRGWEDDLRGERNPIILLHQVFLQQNLFPSWLDFCRIYYLSHKNWLQPQIEANPAIKPHIKARLYRTTLAFVAELDAASLVAKLVPDGVVQKSYLWDSQGVDFRLNHNGNTYNFHIFADTPKARQYRQYKREHKASDGLDGIHIDIPYSLNPSDPHGIAYYPSGLGYFRQSYLFKVLSENLAQRDFSNRYAEAECAVGEGNCGSHRGIAVVGGRGETVGHITSCVVSSHAGRADSGRAG